MDLSIFVYCVCTFSIVLCHHCSVW